MLLEQMIIDRGFHYDVDPQGQIIIFTGYTDIGDDQSHEFSPMISESPFDDWVGGIHEELEK